MAFEQMVITLQAPIRPRPAAKRRGVALLLVVAMLALAGVLAYSLLASSSIAAESAAHARATVVADLMAESGVSLALHYLRHPQDSPVPLINGASGDWHYPGQSNVGIDGESFSVQVSNIAIATYEIYSVGRSRDADGNVCTRMLRVRVIGIGDWVARGAAQFAADISLDPDVLVEGDLLSSGQFDPTLGVVMGRKLAANYTSYTIDATWGPPPALPELVTPSFGSLDLVRAATQRAGYYFYDGARCKADYITSSTLSSPPAPSAENPGRVFIYSATTPLTLSGASARTFQGTLVLTNANLVIQQNWTFTPVAGMPGLLVKGTTALNGLSGSLTVNGVFYNGGGFAASTTTSLAPVVINGTMLCPVTTGHAVGSTIAGPLKFAFDAVKATAPQLTRQGVRYSRLQIEDWEQVN